jgi:membrane-bound lytic murein transglycosylase D
MLRLIIVFSLFISSVAYGQDNGKDIEHKKIPVQKILLPFDSPLGIGNNEPEVAATRKPLDDLQKEQLSRISDVYRMHVLSIESQLKNDLVQAESYINDALASIQSLMDDYPEVQNERRFAELYRTVMAEYREFYGISETGNEVEGEIFAIQEELLSDSDNWIAEGYSLPDNISLKKTQVPLVQNQHVNRHLMYYTMRRPDVMDRWLERSEKYFPMMREIFNEEGVPEELIHLSMIESGLVPVARSWASAVGMWQFIRATGAMYGLEVNWWVDERRDPVKSTRAAARHLKDLHNIWGDWHLAMANYNISPRGLRRAIRAAGGVEDYWVAYPYLPRETRGYVPGFIAATMVAMNPEEFGFQKNYNGQPYKYDVVGVDGLMPLEALAEALNISLAELKDYNPELLRWATPPGDSYPLKIPAGKKEEFLLAYREIPKEKRSQEVAMHTVNSGETLGFIARRYGTSVRALFESNENLSSTIYPGQTIVVPVAPGAMETISADRPSNQPRRTAARGKRAKVQAPPNTTPVSYTVKSGDTIGHIAEWHDVRAWQIRAWNGISNTIRVGQSVTVHVPNSRRDFYKQINSLKFDQKQNLEKRQRSGQNIFADVPNSSQNSGEEISYTVRRNETLSSIAKKFGVSVASIQRTNNLNGTRIYAGQELKIERQS